jgi:Spy/CpxP family protein refolding chaperone
LKVSSLIEEEMKIILRSVLVTFMLLMLVATVVTVSAMPQSPQQDPSPTPAQDPITMLNLTPEQRQKIRAIRAESKEERATIIERVKSSNEALERTLDADNPNEEEVELRLRDLAAAQAASTRMRVLQELRIRRVLTPEQIAKWRTIRLEAAAQRRREVQEQRRQNGNGLGPNQKNGLAPMLNRRNQQNARP